jgi:hypothetical protein
MVYSCTAVDVGSNTGQLARSCPAPERLVLKLGVQVILLKNLDAERGLVNGTRGVVVDFVTAADPCCGSQIPVVEFSPTGEKSWCFLCKKSCQHM